MSQNYNTFTDNDPNNVILSDNIEINANLPLNARRKFIQKVYNLLTLQLVITCTSIIISREIRVIHDFYLTDLANILCPLLILFMAIYHCIFRCFYETCNITPYKELYLFMVTSIVSYIVSYITVFSNTNNLLISGVITLFSIVVLSLYAYQTKYDFTTIGSIMIILILLLISFVFFTIFVNTNLTNIILYYNMNISENKYSENDYMDDLNYAIHKSLKEMDISINSNIINKQN